MKKTQGKKIEEGRAFVPFFRISQRYVHMRRRMKNIKWIN